jgi:hypothetical protein
VPLVPLLLVLVLVLVLVPLMGPNDGLHRRLGLGFKTRRVLNPEALVPLSVVY